MSQIGTLVILEHRSGTLSPGTLNTVQAALGLGSEIACLVSGHGSDLNVVAKLASETLPVSKVKMGTWQ